MGKKKSEKKKDEKKGGDSAKTLRPRLLSKNLYLKTQSWLSANVVRKEAPLD
jgi:hypothetical protein